MTQKTSTKFGIYGGQFIPEILMPAIEELTAGYEKYKNDPEFVAELNRYLADFAGRPTPLYHAKERRGSSQRPEPGSTEPRLRWLAQTSGSRPWSTWAQSI